MSQCNYCTAKSIKKRAKDKNLKITLIPSTFGLGGIDVFMHPKEVYVKSLSYVDREKYFQAWFMELLDKCVC